jgi:hypothetical protein
MDASVSMLRSGMAVSMAAALALCLLTAAPTAAAVPSICDGSTALTLVGMDT